ncbi:hypothetical protein ACFRAE_12250 [Sphingobacterium sp. HJSM2_6]|uniref:hypothetical protein n=1 Tax=Sphingobacterium sp. HJSM2_6 TaxID=3366264 RepID=UPI003BC0EC34
MKNYIHKSNLLAAVALCLIFGSCSKDDKGPIVDPDDNTRWITVSGALMETEPGDGDGGTMVFSLTPEQAKDPNYSVNVFDQGAHVKSDRTARLQASADGKYLYNIQYTGDDGGVFQKYLVTGGKAIVAQGNQVATATYVTTSPRWLKAAEGVGVAVRAAAKDVKFTGTAPNFVFQERTADVNVISLDLNDPKISANSSFELRLTDQEIAQGYYVSRIDVPVVNKAGDKVYIGAAVSKHNTSSFTIGTTGLPVFAADNVSDKSWAKTIVLDYPSLKNPKIITSDKTRANTNGYRSTQQYVGSDGHVYQSTSGEAKGKGGSKILRINSTTNDYDNNYVLSLDQVLGVTDSYLETWKYVGDGIAYVVYAVGGTGKGGYIAKINLNTKTVVKYNVPNSDKLNFRQIQNIAQIGDEVFISIAEVGKDGNIYVFNKNTESMTVGAKLINKTGNQYIGTY